jgi:hypothetical protein
MVWPPHSPDMNPIQLWNRCHIDLLHFAELEGIIHDARYLSHDFWHFSVYYSRCFLLCSDNMICKEFFVRHNRTAYYREVQRVVRCRRSHTSKKIGSQMAVKLSALRTSCALPFRKIPGTLLR